MSGRDPSEIWDRSVDKGERRLSRSPTGPVAAGLVGGVDVMLGILALTVTTGALLAVMPEETAHLKGAHFPPARDTGRAMSKENVELVRRLVEAFNAQDALAETWREIEGFTFREGKIAAARYFLDRDEALQAAGLAG